MTPKEEFYFWWFALCWPAWATGGWLFWLGREELTTCRKRVEMLLCIFAVPVFFPMLAGMLAVLFWVSIAAQYLWELLWEKIDGSNEVSR